MVVIRLGMVKLVMLVVLMVLMGGAGASASAAAAAAAVCRCPCSRSSSNASSHSRSVVGGAAALGGATAGGQQRVFGVVQWQGRSAEHFQTEGSGSRGREREKEKRREMAGCVELLSAISRGDCDWVGGRGLCWVLVWRRRQEQLLLTARLVLSGVFGCEGMHRGVLYLLGSGKDQYKHNKHEKFDGYIGLWLLCVFSWSHAIEMINCP